MPFYAITKLEAAKRQLECALKLFFNDHDSISIHTLAAASHNILRDLSKKGGKNIKSVIYDKNLEYVKEEMKKDYIRMLRKPQNFFKHAKNDPGDTLKFNPGGNNFLLWDTVLMYDQFSDDFPFWIKAYKIWFIINNLHYFDTLPELYYSTLQKLKNKDYTKDKKMFVKLMREADSVVESNKHIV